MIADSTGAFFFDLLPGTYTFETSRIGYTSMVEPSLVEEGNALIVRLLPRPILLEGITATVSRMERRRRSAPTRVFAFEGAALGTSASPSLRRFLQERAGVAMITCPGADFALGRACVLSRGRPSSLRIYLDEVPMTASAFALLEYRPSDFEIVEYYAGSRMLRLYTSTFIEHVAGGGGLISAILW